MVALLAYHFKEDPESWIDYEAGEDMMFDKFARMWSYYEYGFEASQSTKL